MIDKGRVVFYMDDGKLARGYTKDWSAKVFEYIKWAELTRRDDSFILSHKIVRLNIYIWKYADWDRTWLVAAENIAGAARVVELFRDEMGFPRDD